MPELIPIDEFARRVGRSVDTVRDWTERGFTSTGVAIEAYRDGATKIRWYDVALVERVRKSLFRQPQHGIAPSRP